MACRTNFSFKVWHESLFSITTERKKNSLGVQDKAYYTKSFHSYELLLGAREGELSCPFIVATMHKNKEKKPKLTKKQTCP